MRDAVAAFAMRDSQCRVLVTCQMFSYKPEEGRESLKAPRHVDRVVRGGVPFASGHPELFGQVHRLSGGGAPMSLRLWTLSLWSLGESRGGPPLWSPFAGHIGQRIRWLSLGIHLMTLQEEVSALAPEMPADIINGEARRNLRPRG
jgi:hypothetical protein